MIFDRYITSTTLSFFRAIPSMLLIWDSFITLTYSAMHIICVILFLEIKTMENNSINQVITATWNESVAWIQSKRRNKRHLRTKLVKAPNPDNSAKLCLQVLLLKAINKRSSQCDRYYGAWSGLFSVLDIYVFWLNLSCPKPTISMCSQV